MKTTDEDTAVSAPLVSLPKDPMFRDFACRFIDKVEQSMPEIVRSIDGADAKRLAELAHWIKGTGGTVGLQPFTDIGVELHAAAKAGDYVTARLLFAEIGIMVETLKQESRPLHAGDAI